MITQLVALLRHLPVFSVIIVALTSEFCYCVKNNLLMIQSSLADTRESTMSVFMQISSLIVSIYFFAVTA